MRPALVFSIILIIGASQGVLLSLVLFTIKRGNKRANHLLGLIVLLFSIMIMPHASPDPEAELKGELWGEYLMHTLFFLLPPLVYYYVKILTGFSIRFVRKDLLHIIPFLLFSILLLFSIPINITGGILRITGWLLTPLLVLQLFIYLFFSIRKLQLHRRNISGLYSALEKINLNWLSYLLWGQIIIWPLFLAAEITGWLPGNSIWIMPSVFVCLMGYFGLTQPEIFAGAVIEAGKIPEENNEEGIISEKNPKKYARSALTEEMAADYYCRLMDYMKKEKPYLRNDLTLHLLSSGLSVSGHHLSQVINEKCRQNFFEFINSYRIEEAKRLLGDQASNYLTVAAIGFEAGFNSVSSFNTLFRKATGTTPSQFRRIHCK